MIRRTLAVLGVLLVGLTVWVAPASGSRTGALIVGTDQSTGGRILLLDSRVGDWSAGNPAALRWSWRPSAANGFAAEQAGWSNPSEARLRTDRHGRRVLLTAASGGLLAVAEYPSGHRRWAVNAGGPANPHAVELLPDGNVAAAASTGGWVRVYTASQGPSSARYVEFPLRSAHGVLWDPRARLLWTIGHDHLVALRIGGSAAAPTLTEARRVALPTADGHDLQPVYGDPDRLWITTGTRVYQYRKSTNTFGTDYPDAAPIDRAKVKAVGNHPATGQVVQTTPKAGCRTTWCTDTVDLFRPARQHTRPGAEFYKARWWVPQYQ